MADAIRRTLVRQAVEEGRMPARLPELPVTRGPGSGRPCAICGKPLRASEDELEVRAQDACYNVEVFRVHAECEAEWRGEIASGGAP